MKTPKRNYFKNTYSTEHHSDTTGLSINKAVVRDSESDEYVLAQDDSYTKDLGLLKSVGPNGVHVQLQGEYNWTGHGFTPWKRLYVTSNGELTEVKPSPKAFSRFLAIDSNIIMIGKLKK